MEFSRNILHIITFQVAHTGYTIFSYFFWCYILYVHSLYLRHFRFSDYYVLFVTYIYAQSACTQKCNMLKFESESKIKSCQRNCAVWKLSGIYPYGVTLMELAESPDGITWPRCSLCHVLFKSEPFRLII